MGLQRGFQGKVIHVVGLRFGTGRFPAGRRGVVARRRPCGIGRRCVAGRGLRGGGQVRNGARLNRKLRGGFGRGRGGPLR